MNTTKRLLAIWLPIALAATCAIGGAYVMVQQQYRQDANDPQIQFAEDASSWLGAGLTPSVLLSSLPTIDMSSSLSSFGILFDDAGHVIASTGSVASSTPVPPAGTFAYARAHSEDRFTWQTAGGLRFAAVLRHYSGNKASGFFLAARSLREVEKRESQLGLLAGGAWLAAIILSLIAVLAFGAL